MSGIAKSLSNFFRIGKARYFVGKDLHQNSYYELPSLFDTTGTCESL